MSYEKKHKNQKPIVLPFMLAFSAIIRWGAAAEYLEESFPYEDGPLVGAVGSPWEAHSGAGNGPVQVIDGAMQLASNQQEDVYALLEGEPFEVDGPVSALYAAWEMTVQDLPSGNGTYCAHFRSGSSHRARVWISTAQAADGHYRLGIGNSSGADAESGQVEQDLALNQTYRVVMRYRLDTGLSAIAVDPDSEDDLTVVATDPVGLTSINSLAFRQSSGMGQMLIDQITVSGSYPGSRTSSPALEILPQGEGVQLRWPDDATNYVLQSTASLSDPDWQDDGRQPERTSSWWTVLESELAGQRYYRLRQP